MVNQARAGGAETETSDLRAAEKISVLELPYPEPFIEKTDRIEHPPVHHKADAVGKSEASALSQLLRELAGVGWKIIVVFPFSNCRAHDIELLLLREPNECPKPVGRNKNIIVDHDNPLRSHRLHSLIPGSRTSEIFFVRDNADIRAAGKELRRVVRRTVVDYDDFIRSLARAIMALQKPLCEVTLIENWYDNRNAHGQ